MSHIYECVILPKQGNHIRKEIRRLRRVQGKRPQKEAWARGAKKEVRRVWRLRRRLYEYGEKKGAGSIMEIEWKKITVEDRPLIEHYYEREQSMSCEFSFANNLLWAPYYNIRYAVLHDCLVFCHIKDRNTFSVSYPLGRGDVLGAVEELLSGFAGRNLPFRMHLVTPQQYAHLMELCPMRFQIAYDRDAADYVYESEKLKTLAGKKLHGKRNHINRFKQEHPDWSFERIDGHNVEECIEMAKEWGRLNDAREDWEKSAEFDITFRALRQREQLKLDGGLIRADGRVVAFSLGEPCSRETYVVHIEKAFADVQGAYPIMNQQFVEHVAAGFRYINREEDMGAEGLRKAKLSYYPDLMVEKGTVTERPEVS